MSRPSLAVRMLWLVAALLQLALPGAAAWADARLDAAGAHARAHVESHTTSSCARVHPPDCALCHLLSAPRAPCRPAALRLEPARGHVTRRAEPGRLRPAVSRLHPQPRAPPALS